MRVEICLSLLFLNFLKGPLNTTTTFKNRKKQKIYFFNKWLYSLEIQIPQQGFQKNNNIFCITKNIGAFLFATTLNAVKKFTIFKIINLLTINEFYSTISSPEESGLEVHPGSFNLVRSVNNAFIYHLTIVRSK